VAEICIENDILLISDDIHCDLVFPGYRHVPLAGLSKRFAEKIIVCTAASKTFNLAGLHTSNIIIPNRRLRNQFRIEMGRMAYGSPNVFGMTATQAAYEKGEDWLNALLDYLLANYEYVQRFFNKNLPLGEVINLEGTYLVWADFRKYGLQPEALAENLEKKAKVALNHGYTFGPGGEGFERINIACPRSILREALGRMAHSLNS
jgi:cystathionine beta-lyase